MPGLLSGYHAIRMVFFGGTFTTSSSDRQAGGLPSISIIKPVDLQQFIAVVESIDAFWLTVAIYPRQLQPR